MTKFLVIGDLHGRKPILKTKDFDAVILVGDICDDREIAPMWKKWFAELKKNRKRTPKNIDLFIKQNYPNKSLKKMEKISLQKGRKILENLNKIEKPIFIVPGNWDQSYGKTRIKEKNFDKTDYNYQKSFFDFWLGETTNKKLIGGLKNIFDLQYNIVQFQDINLIGYGLVSAPEWDEKRNKKRGKGNFSKLEKEKLLKTYSKILRKISEIFLKRIRKNMTIFISHDIPYNTKLDIVKNKDSYANKMHLGSTVARAMCVKFKPELCVGGHIHEGKGKDKLGKTILVNPGYGPKAQVLIDIDEEKRKIKKIQFLK